MSASKAATKAAATTHPLLLFSLTIEEYQLLNHIHDQPKRWRGFSPEAVNYMLRRHLVNACCRGRILAITLAGLGTFEAINILLGS